jgi:uncharacterized protein (TIGR00369 family)
VTPSEGVVVMNAEALNRFMAEAFPESSDEARARVMAVSPGFVRASRRTAEADLRPGAIVSGPTQMALADLAAYALVLAHIGPVAMAVTSAFTMHFLRPCPPGELFADARLLRLGRRIVTMDVRLWTRSPDAPVAQATVAYTQP